MDSYILNTNNILPIKLPVISRPKFLMCWNIVNFFGELITSEEGCIMTSAESDKNQFYYSQWKQFYSYINTYDITMIGTKNQCNYLRDLVKSYKMIIGRVSDCITYIEVNDKNDVEKELNKLINKNAKFDVCLMNPPYGTTGGDDIHYRFTEKCINVCDDVICIMPFALINQYTSVSNKYKKILGPHLYVVDEINGNIFTGTNQLNVGIYNFKHVINDNNICINYVNGQSEYVKTLSTDQSTSVFTDYEQNFLSYIKLHESQFILRAGDHTHAKSDCKKKQITADNDIETYTNNMIINSCNKLPNNKIYMRVSASNGAMNAKFMSSEIGDIFVTKDDLINRLILDKASNGYNFIIFNNVNEAENCKHALQNSLLRFTLAKLQYNQSMVIKTCYQYVPNIDWSDPRVVTDEGLLEVCGCPKDKCKEYAEYCRKYMEEFDKQHQSKKKKVK